MKTKFQNIFEILWVITFKKFKKSFEKSLSKIFKNLKTQKIPFLRSSKTDFKISKEAENVRPRRFWGDLLAFFVRFGFWLYHKKIWTSQNRVFRVSRYLPTDFGDFQTWRFATKKVILRLATLFKPNFSAFLP